MGKRRKARELAVQVHFHLDFNPGDPKKGFDLICEKFNFGESIRSFSERLVTGVCEKKEELDRLISRASKNWRLDRMPRLDKIILRLAAFEMLFMEDIPPKVSINEAVEMGKKFGGEDSGSFINGVLDHIYINLVQEGRLKEGEDGQS
jgi:transcription antitermination factor NusB